MSKYRSLNESDLVDSPAEGEGEVITVQPGTEPDMPETSDKTETIGVADSTREPDTAPEGPESYFRSEDGAAAPVAPEQPDTEQPAAPEETPVAPPAPMDTPVAPGADATPADAPAPEQPVTDQPAFNPAAVPAAAPMAQPDTEVVPTDNTSVPPTAPEVAASPNVGAVEPAPTAPAEEAPVDNAALQARFKQEGEEITIQTEEPRVPEKTETEECPESGDTCITKDVNAPINPVVTSEDDLTEDVGTEAPAPAEEPTHDDVTAITPETAEDDDDLAEIDQCMRMEDEADVEAGDQDVNATVNVNVRKDDGDEHAEDTAETGAEVSDDGDQAPKQCGGAKKLFKSEGDQIETVADIVNAPPAEDIVPVPDPNAGSPDASGDPELMFGQWMQEGGDWL